MVLARSSPRLETAEQTPMLPRKSADRTAVVGRAASCRSGFAAGWADAGFAARNGTATARTRGHLPGIDVVCRVMIVPFPVRAAARGTAMRPTPANAPRRRKAPSPGGTRRRGDPIIPPAGYSGQAIFSDGPGPAGVGRRARASPPGNREPAPSHHLELRFVMWSHWPPWRASCGFLLEVRCIE